MSSSSINKSLLYLILINCTTRIINALFLCLSFSQFMFLHFFSVEQFVMFSRLLCLIVIWSYISLCCLMNPKGEKNSSSCQVKLSDTGNYTLRLKTVLCYDQFQLLQFGVLCSTGVVLFSKQLSYGDLSPSNRRRLLKMDVAPSRQSV